MNRLIPIDWIQLVSEILFRKSFSTLLLFWRSKMLGQLNCSRTYMVIYPRMIQTNSSSNRIPNPKAWQNTGKKNTSLTLLHALLKGEKFSHENNRTIATRVDRRAADDDAVTSCRGLTSGTCMNHAWTDVWSPLIGGSTSYGFGHATLKLGRSALRSISGFW